MRNLLLSFLLFNRLAECRQISVSEADRHQGGAGPQILGTLSTAIQRGETRPFNWPQHELVKIPLGDGFWVPAYREVSRPLVVAPFEAFPRAYAAMPAAFSDDSAVASPSNSAASRSTGSVVTAVLFNLVAVFFCVVGGAVLLELSKGRVPLLPEDHPLAVRLRREVADVDYPSQAEEAAEGEQELQIHKVSEAEVEELQPLTQTNRSTPQAEENAEEMSPETV